MKNWCFLCSIICFQLVTGQEKEFEKVKSADITSGILKNGMHYYIMHNEAPQDRAAFYFAQNVGSILEQNNQRGLAHFLEHMAFNGTEHFKNKEMLEYLEKNGMKFGEEINASTHYDETVYRITNVPVQNERLLDSILLIFHDWSGGLTLSGEEIDDERGVVREEWRSRYNPQRNATDSVMNQGLLKGSKYARRGAIGTMEVINNFKYDDLRNYYEKWYRPDLQAVIIVGDIDEKKIEERVKKIFSDIPLKSNLPERKKYDVKVGDEFTYLNITNQELGVPTIEYYIRYEADSDLDEKQTLQHKMKLSMLSSIIDNRLIQIARRPSSPVFSARFTSSDFKLPKALGILKITLQPKKNSLMSALQLAARELRRFALYGATNEEFDRVKSSRIRGLQNIVNKSGSSNIYHALEIAEAFFNNHQFLDYKWSHQYQLDYLKSLENEDLVKFFNQYYENQSNVVAIMGADTIEYPSEKEVLRIVAKSKNSTPEPYKEIKVEDKKLVDLQLSGSKIVKEEKIEGTTATKYILANGAQVILCVEPKLDDGIYFKGISPGGRSLVDEELIQNALFATNIAEQSGIANLNKEQLKKSNEVVVPTVKIEDYQETLYRFVNKNSLENLLKGIYLSFEQPSFNEQDFEDIKQQLENLYELLSASVQSSLSDSLLMAKANYSPREVHLTKNLLDNLSIDAAEKVYQNRIKNAADFQFIFVGNVEKQNFETLIEKYIGSIPGNNDIEKPVDHNMRPKKGITKVHISREMQTPQSTVSISVTGDLPYTNENRLAITVIEQLLTKRYMERIREEEGGTYGVRVKGKLQYIPQETFSLEINFNCNPEKTEKLVNIVYEELEKLSNTVEGVELSEIKNNLKKSLGGKNNFNNTDFENLVTSIETGITISTKEENLESIENLSEDEIMQVAKRINKNPRVVEGVLVPKIEKSK